MDYSSIILELMSRIQTLEEKVRILESKNGTEQEDVPVITSGEISDTHTSESSPTQTADFSKVSPKYRPLAIYLVDRNERAITLNYTQLQKILGFDLPSSAHNHMNQYWANTDRHSYSSSWLNVGYKTRVNVANKTVTFEKVR